MQNCLHDCYKKTDIEDRELLITFIGRISTHCHSGYVQVDENACRTSLPLKTLIDSFEVETIGARTASITGAEQQNTVVVGD